MNKTPGGYFLQKPEAFGKAVFTTGILITRRIPVKLPMVQLANANLLTYKIEQRHWRVGLQSGPTY